MESWSNTREREDRTRFAQGTVTTTQVAESWSNARKREDRTPCTQVSVSTSRIAESWSNTRKRADRTRLATVDIRQGMNAAESWSNTLEREDRTRIADAGDRGRWWTKQTRNAAIVAVAGVAFFASAEVAFADSDPSGTTATQPVATGPSTTYTESPVLVRETTGTAGTTTGETSGQSTSTGTPSSTDSSSTNSNASETSDTAPSGTDDLGTLVDDLVSASPDSSESSDSTADTSSDAEPEDPPIDPGDDPSSNSQLAGTGAVCRSDRRRERERVGSRRSAREQRSGEPEQRRRCGCSEHCYLQLAFDRQRSGRIRLCPGGTDGAEQHEHRSPRRQPRRHRRCQPEQYRAGRCSRDRQHGLRSRSRAGSANTGSANTGPANTGSANTGSANTGPANTGSANTGSANTGLTGSANATASQTAPSNINVIVRVDSPGNNGSVTQENAATATAGTSLPPHLTSSPGGSAGPFGTDQLVTTSGSGNANERRRPSARRSSSYRIRKVARGGLRWEPRARRPAGDRRTARLQRARTAP